MSEDSIQDVAKKIEKVANEKGQPIKWKDVNDDISSGEWGRAIQKRVVIEQDEGYVVNEDFDGGDESQSHKEAQDFEYERPKLTFTEKLFFSGIVLLSIFILTGSRDFVGKKVDILLHPLQSNFEFHTLIFIIAIITGVYSVVINLYYNFNYDNPSDTIKQKLATLSEQDDRNSEEVFRTTSDFVKSKLKPILWISTVTLPLIFWLGWIASSGNISGSFVVPIAGEVDWSDLLLGPFNVWIFWYLLCSISFNQVTSRTLRPTIERGIEKIRNG